MFYTNCLKEHSSLTLTQIYSFQDGVVDVPKASDFNRLRTINNSGDMSWHIRRIALEQQLLQPNQIFDVREILKMFT